uniref:RING-type domain-containing protein n=1 Tax=Amphiprion ocellaris TaxID=80972 RepID=A0A3Q1C6U7_AMPOC
QHAGATKDVFTMKEVMFYLGQYIIQKQLYDQKQQHIVHCSQDALGRVLGVNSFSIKEPRVLFAMITKNLVTSDSSRKEEPAPFSLLNPNFLVLSGGRHRKSLFITRQEEELQEQQSSLEESDEEEEEKGEGRKRRRSDSYSLTFDNSVSWCVIGGLVGGRDRGSSQSSDSHSTVTVAASDSDSDNFSVEFEVESVDSDDYNEDDASLSEDDQVKTHIYQQQNQFKDQNQQRMSATEINYCQSATCGLFRHRKYQSHLSNSVQHLRGLLRTVHDIKPDETDPHYVFKPHSNGITITSCFDHKQPNCQLSSSIDSQELLPSSSPAPSSAKWRLPDSCPDPCLICQSRPKNGCIVHGQTGHLMSCYVCARKLKKRDKLCPVCRLPIQSVVLTYLS